MARRYITRRRRGYTRCHAAQSARITVKATHTPQTLSTNRQPLISTSIPSVTSLPHPCFREPCIIKHEAKMPWLHTETYPLPEQDVVSFAFGDPRYDLDKPVCSIGQHALQSNPFQIYHDLDDESRTLSHNQGKTIVRKIVAGFRAAGLQKGDCFAITSFNDVGLTKSWQSFGY